MKRRWFQIHLSTAIVLMFITSALLWANLQLQNEPLHTRGNEMYGFPFVLLFRWSGEHMLISKHQWFRLNYEWMLSFKGFVLNGLSWSSLLLVPAFTLEALIRRAENKREAQKP
jgi:hypothetical protein